MTITPKIRIDAGDVESEVRAAYSAQAGIVARAGGGQANATQITKVFNRVVTVATAADSVKLPAAIPGASLTIANRGGASMNVFPQTGEFINALTVNSAFAMANNATSYFFCALEGRWDAVS